MIHPSGGDDDGTQSNIGTCSNECCSIAAPDIIREGKKSILFLVHAIDN